MNKSAKSTQVYLVGEFVLIGILILMFGTIMNHSSNSDLLEKAVTATDVARTMDIAQSTARNFRYEYPESLEGYKVELDGYSLSLVKNEEDFSPDTKFSFNKQYFKLRDGARIPKKQVVDGSDFYILKKGDEIKFGDFKSTQEFDMFKVTTKDKPNVTVESDLGISSFDLTLDKLSTVVLEEIKRNFDTGKQNKFIVKISSHDGTSDEKNIIYYSSNGEEDTKAIAENMQLLLKDEINLLAVPISKDYEQKKVIEFSLADNIENKKLFGEDNIRRKMAFLISSALTKYYLIGR